MIWSSPLSAIFPHAGVPKARKHELESLAFEYIKLLLEPCDKEIARLIFSAWDEYEEGKTAEGRFMKEMDKFECLVQACEYEQSTRGDPGLEEFQGLCSKVQSPEGKAWLALLQRERIDQRHRRETKRPAVFLLGNSELCTKYGTLLSQSTQWRYISLQDIVEKRSADPAYPQAAFLKKCLALEIDIPNELAISMLDVEIGKYPVEGINYLLHGFLQNERQLEDYRLKGHSPEKSVRLVKDQPSNSVEGGLLAGNSAGGTLSPHLSIKEV